MNSAIDVVIVGAGPYGLSIAAHLRKAGVNFRIFGIPMQNWSERMPQGMLLKSEGFASSLFDPDSAFTLRHYCDEMGIPYEDVGIPVEGKTFVAYGQEFQRRLVPSLEQTNIESIERHPKGFRLRTATGETLEARRVILAVGITHFAYLPPTLTGFSEQYVTHSLHHHDLSIFKGRKVAVVGGGASAVDLAGLLQDAGAEAHLIARRSAISFHTPTLEPRSLRARLVMPRSGLGLGWRSRLCTDAPLVFHQMPQKLRTRVVQRHLGPSSGWFAREKIEGRVAMHLGMTVRELSIANGQITIHLRGRDGSDATLETEHIIAATGFRTELSRMKLLDTTMLRDLRTEDGSPVLSRHFESSLSGLYFVGLASANAFGPLFRFAYGARFAARQLTGHLVSSTRKAAARHPLAAVLPQWKQDQAG